MSRKITFPVVNKNDRRNNETGVTIYNDGRDGYAVMIPAPLSDRMLFRSTLAEAREAAITEAEFMREAIAEAYVEAHAEAEDRILNCDYCDSDEGDTTHWDGPTSAENVAFTCREHEARVDALRDENGRVTRKQVHDDRAAYAAEQRGKTDAQRAREIVESIPAEARVGKVAELCEIAAKQARTPADALSFAQAARDLYDSMPATDLDVPAEAPVKCTNALCEWAGNCVPNSTDKPTHCNRSGAPLPTPAPVKYDHGLEVRLADDATYKPQGHEAETFETDWRATPERTPGGRMMVQIFRSYNDPVRGFSTVAPTVWLDELRTLDGARVIL